MSTHRKFTVEAPHASITCLLAEPSAPAPRPALLLSFAVDRVTMLQRSPFDIPARQFLAAGHRVVSFDLPCHGERGTPAVPGGLAGFCAHWEKGTDVFERFVEEGRAVIDALVLDGLAESGRVYVAGTSRGGYFVLRLMAADARVAGAAAYAPVTDWRAVSEFAAIRDQPSLTDLDLSRFAGPLAGRAVWVGIGNADRRVGTDHCLRFAEALVRAESAQGVEASRFELHVVPEEGHSLSDDWRRRGGEFLLARAGKGR